MSLMRRWQHMANRLIINHFSNMPSFTLQKVAF